MINKYYLDKNIMSQIHDKLISEKVVQLEKFFDKKYFDKISKKINNIHYSKQIKHLNHKYSISKNKDIIREVINKELRKFISSIIEKKLQLKDSIIISISSGDFKIISDSDVENSECIIDFTSIWDEKWGGNTMYTDGDGNYIKIIPKSNTLTISKSSTLKRFFQYTNNHAENNKRTIIISNIR